ncbi:FKBP-type peptidyl-prolyl cis-trans isomerase [Myxococcota bacterium]|nr:FKBP-type peptidyl-prolyl cis-trans isomerase [Myxococcota bacterium]
MRRTAIAMAASSALVMAAYFQATASDTNRFASDKARESYAMGALIGQQMGQEIPELEVGSFVDGLAAALRGEDSQLSDAEILEAVASFEQRQMEKARQQLAEVSAKNSADGEAFREKFASDAEVVTLASGVQYKVLETGEGDQPASDSMVVVHYRGTLIDGTEFDSSYSRNEPAQFPVSRVIPGWSEVLQEMTVGSKWKVVVPPELAYGERGAGALIQPNATLVFDIELIEIS